MNTKAEKGEDYAAKPHDRLRNPVSLMPGRYKRDNDRKFDCRPDENTPKYLLKIARKLRGAGMLGTVTGAKGGYYLLRSLEEITLLDVLNVMESSVKVNRCLEDDGYCNRGAVSTCQIRKYYQYIQKEMENKWFSRRPGRDCKNDGCRNLCSR